MDVQKMVAILQLYKIHTFSETVLYRVHNRLIIWVDDQALSLATYKQVQSAVVAMMSKIVSVQGNVSKQILKMLNRNVQILEDVFVPWMNYPEINVVKKGVILMVH